MENIENTPEDKINLAGNLLAQIGYLDEQELRNNNEKVRVIENALEDMFTDEQKKNRILVFGLNSKIKRTIVYNSRS